MIKTKILVTGGAGFIGSHLVDQLVANGSEVFVIDDLSRGNLANLNQKAKFIKTDIASWTFTMYLEKIRPQIVFHLAAQSSISRSLKNPEEDIKINLLATAKLLEIAKEVNVEKIIFASSAAIFGHAKKLPIDEDHSKQPISTYGLVKLCAEYFLQFFYKSYQNPYVCLRLANVYGPRQDSSGEGGVVAIFAKQIIKNDPVIIYGSGEQTRDFIYVSDVVEAFIKSIKDNVVGEFNLGTSQQISINQLAAKLPDIYGLNQHVKVIHKPQRFLEVEKSALSHQKFKETTGFQPKIRLDEGLAKTIDYFKIVNT